MSSGDGSTEAGSDPSCEEEENLELMEQQIGNCLKKSTVEEYKRLMGVEFARWAKAIKREHAYLVDPNASPPTMDNINLQVVFDNEQEVWPLFVSWYSKIRSGMGCSCFIF